MKKAFLSWSGNLSYKIVEYIIKIINDGVCFFSLFSSPCGKLRLVLTFNKKDDNYILICIQISLNRYGTVCLIGYGQNKNNYLIILQKQEELIWIQQL